MLTNEYYSYILGGDEDVLGLKALDNILDTMDSFGIDLNISLIKNEPGDYQMGIHLRSGDGEDQINVESVARGEKMSEVIETVRDELIEQIGGKKDESKSAVENKYEKEISSLRTDNALLEHRISELTAQLEKMKQNNAQNNVQAKLKEKQFKEFSRLLDSFDKRGLLDLF